MTAYYNEIDPKAAAWLRELIAHGHIADGDVDERSIEDVTPNEIAGYTQCHFFAGIGVWSYALRQAGWPDGRAVWTGSCPCQPFSAAGKGAGFADERHLWPAFHHLIKVCQPAIIFGEQVAHKAGATWFDLVQADLAGEGYAAGMVVFPACGIGAPHMRQRLYWVGYPSDTRLQRHGRPLEEHGQKGRQEAGRLSAAPSVLGELADTPSHRQPRQGARATSQEGREARPEQSGQLSDGLEGRGASRSVDITNGQRLAGRKEPHSQAQQSELEASRRQDARGLRGDDGPMPTNGKWGDVDWLFCRDGKWRPVEPGTFPLADGAPERVGRLRGYGNAIVAPQAEIFIGAFLDAVEGGAA